MKIKTLSIFKNIDTKKYFLHTRALSPEDFIANCAAIIAATKFRSPLA